MVCMKSSTGRTHRADPVACGAAQMPSGTRDHQRRRAWRQDQRERLHRRLPQLDARSMSAKPDQRADAEGDQRDQPRARREHGDHSSGGGASSSVGQRRRQAARRRSLMASKSQPRLSLEPVEPVSTQSPRDRGSARPRSGQARLLGGRGPAVERRHAVAREHRHCRRRRSRAASAAGITAIRRRSSPPPRPRCSARQRPRGVHARASGRRRRPRPAAAVARLEPEQVGERPCRRARRAAGGRMSSRPTVAAGACAVAPVTTPVSSSRSPTTSAAACSRIGAGRSTAGAGAARRATATGAP